jgi:uncharacterized protein (TIGR03435 family)
MRMRVALVIQGIVIAIGVSMGAQGIAYAQVGAVFELSPALAAADRGPAGNLAKTSRTAERIAFRAALVPEIVAFAYGFPLDRVERQPQWMYDNRYDVAVTTTAPTSLPEQRHLLQELLEERFGLAVHRLSYESWVYYLVPGPTMTLTAAHEDDATDIPRFNITRRSTPESAPGKPVCVARHVSMSDLAAWLSTQLKLPVLDKTGITGFFDFDIPGLPPRGGADGTIQATENALGLHFEVHRGTAETLIIDHSEKPALN